MAKPKPRRTFTKEFKLDVIAQSFQREKITELASELGIRPELIYRWRSEYKEHDEQSFPGKGIPNRSKEEQEIAELKRKLADVKMERDILKKAIGIFTNKNT